MDSTSQLDETPSTGLSRSDLRDSSPERDPPTNLVTGFLWLFVLFTTTAYISQSVIFQSLEHFLKDIKDMEDICVANSNSFNDEKCECVFAYLEGLDHPRFQYLFNKLQLTKMENPKTSTVNPQGNKNNAWNTEKDFVSEMQFVDPTAYVVGCGNDVRLANKDVCEQLDKLIATDLWTKWWYEADASCFNSIFNTIKRVHPAMVLAFALVVIAVVLTPIRLLQTFQVV